MKIKFTFLHQISHEDDLIREVDISNQTGDLRTYTSRLIDEITTSLNKRQFEFSSETTEIRTAIDKFLDNDSSNGSSIIVNRLLKVEKEAQKRIDHLGRKIQRGSLFQAVLYDSGITTIIITKADHDKFLDEVDFKVKNGLPWEKRIFKAFLAKFDKDKKQVGEIYVYDTTNRMAKYWWDDFLELRERYTDTHNTQTALDILDKKIFNKIKTDYPADHTILRNSTIGYFRNKDEFEMGEYIKDIFEDYTPINETFPKEDYILKIQELPQKWKFDSRFGIIKGEIKKRQVNKIPLTEGIELVLKGYIKNLNNIISTEVDKEGNKYIRIKTNVGFERFKMNASI